MWPHLFSTEDQWLSWCISSAKMGPVTKDVSNISKAKPPALLEYHHSGFYRPKKKHVLHLIRKGKWKPHWHGERMERKQMVWVLPAHYAPSSCHFQFSQWHTVDSKRNWVAFFTPRTFRHLVSDTNEWRLWEESGRWLPICDSSYSFWLLPGCTVVFGDRLLIQGKTWPCEELHFFLWVCMLSWQGSCHSVCPHIAPKILQSPSGILFKVQSYTECQTLHLYLLVFEIQGLRLERRLSG